MTENQRLKIIRKLFKATQVNFASSIGLTQAGYSDIERGKNNVSKKIKILLKREHNINLIWLETGDGEMFEAANKDNRFLADGSANDHIFLETLKSEMERLQNEITNLREENSSYSEQVRSKNQIIENLEAQISKR